MGLTTRDVLVVLLFAFFIIGNLLITFMPETDPLLPLYALVYLIGFIAYLVFWIWMIVNCIRHKGLKQKVIWLLLLIFIPVIGTLAYYFDVYRKGSEFQETIPDKKWYQRPIVWILILFVGLPIVITLAVLIFIIMTPA